MTAPVSTRRTALSSLVFLGSVILTGCGRAPAPVAQSATAVDDKSAVRDTPPVATPPAPRTEGYPFKRSVLVSLGIDHYPRLRGAGSLRFAEADARAIEEVLAKLYGFEVVSLLGKSATKKNVEATLKRVGDELGDGDVLVIYFAGHGLVIPAKDGAEQGFLIPADADLDWDDSKDVARWAAEALDMQALTGTLDRMGARHVLFIADACCSGFMTTRGALARADLKTFLFERSRTVLTATTQRQKSRERVEAGHGYFTAALLDELKRDEAASVIDLYGPVLRRVAKETNGNMTPQMAVVGAGDGTFVFIPRSVPRSDLEDDLHGRMPASEKPRGLGAVMARQRERAGRQTTQAELFETMMAVPYATAEKAEELKQLWERRFVRFRENAGLGDGWAMAALHVCYVQGLGTEKDRGQAYQLARRLDAAGSPAGAGKYFLAECYWHGIGVTRQEATARHLYAEAAEKKFLPGEVKTAELSISMPNPTRAEVERAMEVYRRGIDQKYSRAAQGLAILRVRGYPHPGAERDFAKAIAAYAQAADWGCPDSMVALCEGAWQDLPGSPKDLKKAERYLREAASLGHPRAQFLLSTEYLGDKETGHFQYPKNHAEAIRWAILAGEQGYPLAQSRVAEGYAYGLGVEKNLEAAKAWCEKAAAQNDAKAFFLQGTWYNHGLVYSRDREKAVERFLRASDLGHALACERYVKFFRLDDGSFPPDSHDWVQILRQVSKYARQGKLDQEKTRDLVTDAYEAYIVRDGTPSKVRWDAFEKAFPDDAREFKKLLRP
jgi:TPR repeat protein